MGADELMTSDPVRRLTKALALVDSPEDAEALLMDLCTPREIDDLSQRLEVARLLDAGEPYLSVQQSTGASSTTVSRVSKCLNGRVGGYRRVLDRLGASGE